MFDADGAEADGEPLEVILPFLVLERGYLVEYLVEAHEVKPALALE